MADIRSSQVLAQVEWIPPFDYEGSVTITLIPGATHGYNYTGDVSFSLTPAAMAVAGFCYDGNLVSSLSPGAEYSVTKEYLLEASGGLSIGGEGIFAFFIPSTLTVVATGGLGWGGTGIIERESPEIYAEIGSGGLKIFGAGVAVFVDAEEIPEYAVIGSGGIVIGGAGIANFVRILPTYTVTGLGGFNLNGVGTAVFVEAEIVEYSVTGSGGFKVSGLGNFVFITPDDIFTLVGSGGLSLSGAGLITCFSPDFYTVVGSGGLIVAGEGTGEEFVYHTWVLSGTGRKGSIYSNYNFNSYCEYKGKFYAAGTDGISELIGGIDGSNVIHTGVAVGPTNFGTFKKKKIRSVFVGTRNEAKINVSVNTGNITRSGDFLTNKGKAVISRKLLGDEITVNVTDFDELTTMEIIPITLGSRKSR